MLNPVGEVSAEASAIRVYSGCQWSWYKSRRMKDLAVSIFDMLGNGPRSSAQSTYKDVDEHSSTHFFLDIMIQ